MILVIEDDPVTAAYLRGLLRDAGYQVDLASTVAQAVKFFEAGIRPELVCLDLILPDGNGNDLIDWFETKGITPPIIVLSAYIGSLHAEKAKRLPTLEKPIDATAFLALVQEHAADRRE